MISGALLIIEASNKFNRIKYTKKKSPCSIIKREKVRDFDQTSRVIKYGTTVCGPSYNTSAVLIAENCGLVISISPMSTESWIPLRADALFE